MDKEQQKVEARKVYQAISVPAWNAYQAKIDEIEKDDIITVKGKRYKLIEE